MISHPSEPQAARVWAGVLPRFESGVPDPASRLGGTSKADSALAKLIVMRRVVTSALVPHRTLRVTCLVH